MRIIILSLKFAYIQNIVFISFLYRFSFFLLSHATKENYGRTALITAAFRGYTEIVEVLLQNQANVNAKANNGLTALMAAAFYGHIDTVQVLLQNGADIEARDM